MIGALVFPHRLCMIILTEAGFVYGEFHGKVLVCDLMIRTCAELGGRVGLHKGEVMDGMIAVHSCSRSVEARVMMRC